MASIVAPSTKSDQSATLIEDPGMETSYNPSSSFSPLTTTSNIAPSSGGVLNCRIEAIPSNRPFREKNTLSLWIRVTRALTFSSASKSPAGCCESNRESICRPSRAASISAFTSASTVASAVAAIVADAASTTLWAEAFGSTTPWMAAFKFPDTSEASRIGCGVPNFGSASSRCDPIRIFLADVSVAVGDSSPLAGALATCSGDEASSAALTSAAVFCSSWLVDIISA